MATDPRDKIVLLAGILLGLMGVEDLNLAVNPGFESGLTSWQTQGDVQVSQDGAIQGEKSLRIAKGSITQILPMSGLRIIYIASKVHGTALKGELKIECLDRSGRAVMTNLAHFDPKKSEQEPGVYFKTQANTHKIKITLRNRGPAVLVDDFIVRDDTAPESHRPGVDLTEAMLPYWSSPVIHNETVLVESINGAAPAGTLLAPPKKVLSVQGYELKTTYSEGEDYRVTATGIEAIPGGKLPTVRDKDFPTADLQWTDLQGKHVSVTYEKNLEGPYLLRPEPSPNLSATRNLLKAQKPLRIVAFGDSITLGIGTSRYSQRPPFQPTWATLVLTKLQEMYKNSRIKLYNTALGGMTSDWAKAVASEAVASLKPDLVIYGFGMNDFWWMPAEQFKANALAVIESVRKQSPKAEFLLIAPMRFDPEYARDGQYPARLQSYAAVLHSLEEPGVAVLDMTAITGELYARKKPKDFLSDPLHPNDFLSRVHAQWIVGMLSP